MMKHKVCWRRWLGVVIVMLLGGLVFPWMVSAYQGMASSHYVIPWSALSAGGETMASVGFTMQGAVLHSPTGSAGSEHYQLNAGYWPGWFALTGRNVNRVAVQSFHGAREYGYWAIGVLFLLWAGMVIWKNSGRPSQENLARRSGL